MAPSAMVHNTRPAAKYVQQQPTANYEVQRAIQARLDLGNGTSNVVANVDNNSVTMGGWADLRDEHDTALWIAQNYADGRQIVDMIKQGGFPE